jgi:hypothetical protein
MHLVVEALFAVEPGSVAGIGADIERLEAWRRLGDDGLLGIIVSPEPICCLAYVGFYLVGPEPLGEKGGAREQQSSRYACQVFHHLK